MARKYELKQRAERVEETRRRIVEATSGLHLERGPAAASIAEIARRAGVQRRTVYNHFPDDSTLFEACSAHWRACAEPERTPSRRNRLWSASPPHRCRASTRAGLLVGAS